MSVATVKAALVVMQRGISGTRHAFSDPPNSLTSADAPAWINIPGAAEYNWDIYGPGTVQEQRDYRMLLYIGTLGSGLSGEVSRIATPFFDSVPLFFAAHPQLLGVKGVQIALLPRDGGLVGFQFQNEPWVGIEFTLHVTAATAYTDSTEE